jgi:superfamily II DNA/RNA helicase
MSSEVSTRDRLAAQYFDQLPYQPYPVQEEALLAWFTAEQGVLVCTPTGTGKTLIAEAALFEALHTGSRAYYTTPLIALTEQKFEEMKACAVRWGFSAEHVGLVTGNRRVHPDAPVLVVVAEILFNRLLHRELFDFHDVTAVVMDEFHSFNDPERGIVWELTLGLLPQHVRLLLLSATVGNALEFTLWLRKCHDRRLELVQSDQRRVPLSYHWIADRLLEELVEEMAEGDPSIRRTPALVFCFNREECWNVAETLKGKKLLAAGQQAQLADALAKYDWSQGAGPKLRQLLLRGVGVHHAGVLPQYKRIVEDLFQQKLLSFTVCTETLAAGINLPARSVVLSSLVKGPPEKKKLIDPSAAHQMFGRAGRPQFDKQGFVYVLAHEDDVKILRWREKYDQIPEDTPDPSLRKAKKALKRKMPTRRTTEQYWTEAQFNKLCAAPPAKLHSKGPLPWRLLAYMLDASPEVDLIRHLVSKRLMDAKRAEADQRSLDRMLATLWMAGYVTLEPSPPKMAVADESASRSRTDAALAALTDHDPGDAGGQPAYRPERAIPTANLPKLLMFRGVNPLYGVFLINQLGIANRVERIQAMESVLEIPRSVGPQIRVPDHDQMTPGPLATTRLDAQLLALGLATTEELIGNEHRQEERQRLFREEPVRVLTLADKLRRLFDHDFPGVHSVYTDPVWAVGELLEFRGDFNKYVTTNRLQKQEGIVFRHLLRFILLVGEFTLLCPPDTTEEEWRGDLLDIRNQLAASCRAVDPTSTDKAVEESLSQVAQPAY